MPERILLCFKVSRLRSLVSPTGVMNIQPRRHTADRGKNAWQETCPSVTFSTTNITWICPVSNSDLQGEGEADNHMGQWSPGGRVNEALVPGPVL